MTNQISKNLYCIQMRTGIEIWVEKEKAAKLQNLIESISGNKFINFEDQTINTADIVGIFKAETMSDYTQRKNYKWKCEKGKWHDKGKDCDCVDDDFKKNKEKWNEVVSRCGKCKEGWIIEGNDARLCDCVKHLSSNNNYHREYEKRSNSTS